MNRRNFLKRAGQTLLGLGGVFLLGKASPQQETLFGHPVKYVDDLGQDKPPIQFGTLESYTYKTEINAALGVGNGSVYVANADMRVFVSRDGGKTFTEIESNG